MTDKLTLGRANELLKYEPTTGVLVWRVRRGGRANAGSIAGYKNMHGYRHVNIGGRLYYAHRLAFLLMTGRWPSAQIDHRNGHRDDNRWSNLREATNQENGRNQQKIRSDNSSGIRGVSWYAANKKWRAHIGVGGRFIHLGYFDTIEAATDARTTAEKRMFGKFAPGRAPT